jgi:hypothetical protein
MADKVQIIDVARHGSELTGGEGDPKAAAELGKRAAAGAERSQGAVSNEARDVNAAAMGILSDALKAAESKEERAQVREDVMRVHERAHESAQSRNQDNNTTWGLLGKVATVISVGGLGVLLLAKRLRG